MPEKRDLLTIFLFIFFSNPQSTTADQSYTIGLIEQLNKQKAFGTSWNVFGVPNNNVKTSNPYAGMDKSRK